MARRDVKLLGSLIDYVKDIKPYHTKLREFASELIFNDRCSVSVIDDHNWSLHLKNMWGRDDLGGHVYSKIAEGIDADRTFIIPATIWPRFSLNDTTGQHPTGDDPAIDLADDDGDGFPNQDDPYVGNRNISHFLGSDWVPVPAVIVDTDMVIRSIDQSMWDGYVDSDYWDDSYTSDTVRALGELYVTQGYWNATEGDYVLRSNTFRYTYDLTVYVNTAIENAYGLGNYWKSYVDRADVTALTTRDSGGTFDQGEYDDQQFDTRTRAFVIKGLQGEFTISPDDLDIFPDLLSKSPEYIVKYGHAKLAPKVEIYYQNTGRYLVPFHHGSRVYVEGKPAVFGSSYIVESSREFIQFVHGKHPKPLETITVNLMKSDRLFIAQVPPFDASVINNNRAYDMSLYDLSEYDSRSNQFWEPWITGGYGMSLEELPFDGETPTTVCDYFVIRIDDSQPNRHSPVAFYNSSDVEGKGTLNVVKVYPTAQHGDVYLVVATGMWTFYVQKVSPSLGPMQHATFKTTFDNGEISFIIDRTWTPYYMVPDYNTYDDHDAVYQIYPFANVDDTDYVLNLSLKAERGSLKFNDVNHRPVEFASIGKVVKGVDDSGNELYKFVLNKIPDRGTYFEIKVEQNNGFNPRLHANIDDVLVISVFESTTEEVYQEIYNSNDLNDPEDDVPDPVVYPSPDPTNVPATSIPVSRVIADMGYDSEALPLYYEFDWQIHPVVTQSSPRGDQIIDSWTGNRPEWCYDFQSWFIVQEAQGNNASNVRVEVANLRAYYLNETTRTWEQLDVKTLPTIDRFSYPYVVDDLSVTQGVRNEHDGISIKPDFPTFYRGKGNMITLPSHPAEIRAIYVAMDFRIVTDNSDFPDDSSQASYVVQVGADYFPGNGQGSWSEEFPPGIGHGRFLKASGTWKTATMLVPNKLYDSTFHELQYNSPPGTIPNQLPSE